MWGEREAKVQLTWFADRDGDINKGRSTGKLFYFNLGMWIVR